ncbi:Imm1 family immunity protein [Kribbella sp. NPDC050124]|uniref:Imm1 family immunity protein n=1 Tax=Kribbella sp. NPDC050124 TaxID=3364114 RepID=UPI00379A09B3
MAHSAKAYFKHGHGDDPVSLSNAEDVDRLIEDLLAESWENSVAAIYVNDRLNQAGVPDHELLVAVDYDTRTTGSLRYMGDDGVYFSQGKDHNSDPALYYYMGSDREFPRAATLPLADVRTAVKEFLAGGGKRPSAIEWREAHS